MIRSVMNPKKSSVLEFYSRHQVITVRGLCAVFAEWVNEWILDGQLKEQTAP